MAREAAAGGRRTFAETLSGSNGAVVQASVAGLVWLAEGSDLASGPRSDNVRRAARFVAARAGEDSGLGSSGGANWNQSNWGPAHGAIFLGELHARTPDEDVAAALLRCAEGLVRNQEASGGWAHGPGGHIKGLLRKDLEILPFDERTLQLVEDLIAYLRRDTVLVRLHDKGFLHAKCWLFYSDRPGQQILFDPF